MPSPLQRFITDYLTTPFGCILLFWGGSWFLLLMAGGSLIDWLNHRKGMEWAPREDTPDSHLQKAGTPSMGGIGIIGAASISYLAVHVFLFGASSLLRSNSGPDIGLLLLGIFPLLVILHAILGYIDDHSKATNRGGLTSKAKLLCQILLALGFVVVLYYLPQSIVSSIGPTLVSEFWAVFFSCLTIVAALLIIVGTSNAVNLTDGLDGLVAGLCVQVGLAFFAVLTFESYNNSGGGIVKFSAYFFWICLGGASLGFLAFDKYPAKVFMGDTGSLALGAALGAGMLLTGAVSLLPFIGFIFFVEMFSVIIQVVYFKITRKKTGEGKRVFRRAPLHHHFELGGWSEWRVVATFWAVNFVTSCVGLALWKAEMLPRFPGG